MKIRPIDFYELVAVSRIGTPAPKISQEDIETLESLRFNTEYNLEIEEKSIINFSLIHNINKLDKHKYKTIIVQKDFISSENICAFYFNLYKEVPNTPFGGWKLIGSHPVPYLGDSMLGLVYSNLRTTSHSPYYEDPIPEAKTILGVDSRRPITPRQAQSFAQDTLSSEGWSYAIRGKTVLPPSLPEIKAPYFFRPHFEYEFLCSDEDIIVKIARWTIKNKETNIFHNIYIAYTLFYNSLDHKLKNIRWLPIIPEGQLRPLLIQIASNTSSNIPLIILRDCHVNIPAELKEGTEIVAWPSSVHGISASKFNWDITQNRQVYIFIDSLGEIDINSIDEEYKAIYKHNPRSILFICNINPRGVKNPYSDYFKNLGYSYDLALTNKDLICSCFLSNQNKSLYTQPLQSHYSPPLKKGSIAIIHGAPLIGKSTLTLHAVHDSLFGKNELLKKWGKDPAQAVLYAGNDETLIKNMLIHKGNDFGLIKYDSFEGFLLYVDKKTSLMHDTIIIDSPDIYFRNRSQILRLMEIASNLRDQGAFVIITLRTSSFKKYNKFYYLFDVISEIIKDDTTDHNRRKIRTMFLRGNSSSIINEINFSISRHGNIESILFHESYSIFNKNKYTEINNNYISIVNKIPNLTKLEKLILINIINAGSEKLSNLKINNYGIRSIQLSTAPLIDKKFLIKSGKGRATRYHVNLEKLATINNEYATKPEKIAETPPQYMKDILKKAAENMKNKM